MKIEVIDSFERFCELEPVWNDLLSQSDVDNPHLTFEWFSCWWEAFTEKEKPFIVLVKENTTVLAIAPLMETRIRYRNYLTVKTITFIANKHTNRAGFILGSKKKSVVRHLIEFVYRYGRFDVVKLDFIEGGSETDRLLSDVLHEQRVKYRRDKSLSSPYILIDKDWNSYLKSRSKSLRNKLKRRKRNLEEFGDCDVTEYSRGNVTSGIDALYEISKNSWKFKNGSAIVCNERVKKFYTSLIKVLAMREWLRLWILRVDGKPIAYDLTIHYKKRNYSLKTSFDEAHRSLSPGLYLDTYTLNKYFESNDTEVDLLGHKSEYKMRWTSLLRDHQTFLCFNNNFYGKMLALFELVIIRLIKNVLYRFRISRSEG
jgi:CelD/BcsL family acetyltransferase involved in cellulose biosynthesis